tara:strand:+ start:80 stop:571 length:492 start_codon:yes stop_codon:yes gene_type:complete
MNFYKQGDVWCFEDELYAVLSDNNINESYINIICVKITSKKPTENNYFSIPINIVGNNTKFWANCFDIKFMNCLESRVGKVLNFNQLRELLRKYSEIFGCLSYAPIFGYNVKDYTVVEVDKISPLNLPKPKMSYNDDDDDDGSSKRNHKDNEWTYVKYKKKRK